MIDLQSPRHRWFVGIFVVWLATATFVMVGTMLAQPAPVIVTHWANGHLMSDSLLPVFAKKFNAAHHTTTSGARIEVRPILTNSGVMKDQLINRVTNRGKLTDCAAVGCADVRNLPDPVIVSPAADHWLPEVNYAAGTTVVDMDATMPLATTYIGIVMLQEMARCLGYPSKEISIADIVALQENPDGWASCPSARTEWGRKPLISFTDPNSSSTARSVLFSLYAIAAGKPAESLTPADVARPEVIDYVKRFQQSVDHYMPDSLTLMSKIYGGPSYGHIYFIPEDDLVKLYQGKTAVTVVNETKPKPLEQRMLMIYPAEGSTANNHSAAVVNATWVSAEQKEGAARWISFLHEDDQQRAFMEEGLRPATNIPLAPTISQQFGLNPNKPNRIMLPDRLDPQVAAAIVDSWDEVKKPSVAVVVVDTSGSMSGEKIKQAKAGVLSFLDGIDKRSSVGFLTFSDAINSRVAVGPVTAQRFQIKDAADRMEARGATALYDAIAEAVHMADQASGDPNAIRGVVVLTDGMATGGAGLDQLIRIHSNDERSVPRCRAFEPDRQCSDSNGLLVEKKNLRGVELAIETTHPVHIFFVGVGSADLEIGRMLAEASHGAYKPTTEKSLGAALEQFGKYF